MRADLIDAQGGEAGTARTLWETGFTIRCRVVDLVGCRSSELWNRSNNAAGPPALEETDR